MKREEQVSGSALTTIKGREILKEDSYRCIIITRIHSKIQHNSRAEKHTQVALNT